MTAIVTVALILSGAYAIYRAYQRFVCMSRPCVECFLGKRARKRANKRALKEIQRLVPAARLVYRPRSSR